MKKPKPKPRAKSPLQGEPWPYAGIGGYPVSEVDLLIHLQQIAAKLTTVRGGASGS